MTEAAKIEHVCPNCDSEAIRVVASEKYHDYWQCGNCEHRFKKHMTWSKNIMTGNIVKLVPPPEGDRPLYFSVGPTTVQKDITPYESTMLQLLILRAAGNEKLLKKHLDDYPKSMRRHIVFNNP